MKTMSHTNPDGSIVSVCLGDYVSLGNNVRLGNGVSLGNNVSLGDYVRLGHDVSLGDGVSLGDYVILGNGVSLGNHVRLGDYVTLGNGVSLGNSVRLGDGVILGDGARLGDGVSLERVFDAGCDHRGYRFIAGRDLNRDNTLRIFAGCRDFSPGEAQTHWHKKNNREALRKVAYLVAEAKAQKRKLPCGR